jgi:hypothetical protein
MNPIQKALAKAEVIIAANAALEGPWFVDTDPEAGEDGDADFPVALQAARAETFVTNRKGEIVSAYDEIGSMTENLVVTLTPRYTVEEIKEAIDANGAQVVDAFVFEHGAEYAEIEKIADQYLGEFDDVLAYAYQLVEELGVFDGVSEFVTRYFDYALLARDLVLGGDIWTASSPKGVYVFNAH